MDKTKVWHWSADSAGCQAYRMRWPSDALNRHYGDTIDSRFGTRMSEEDREWADVVVGQRVVLPGPSHFWQGWAGSGEKRLVFDLDDDLFAIPSTNAKASATFNNSEVQRRLKANVRAADLVTVSTEPLKQSVHRNTGVELSRIVVIPNALPTNLILNSLPDAERDDAPLLGWLASPTHKEDAKMVSRHLKRFMEAHPKESFHGIGADYGHFMGLAESQNIHSRWIRHPEDAITSIDYRVGICPLLPSVFNRSKSDCKWLELAARGVPAVVSDVPAYDEVRHLETGYKVRYEHEWGKALKTVTGDAALRRHLASNALDYVKTHRTIDNTVSMWKDAIQGV